MPRHKKRVQTAKQYQVKRVSTRHIRKSIKRGQLKVRKTTLEVRRPRSLRGRTQLMEAPALGQPIQPQDLLVGSTALRRFKYYIEQQRLRVWFTTGHVYDYLKVPESVVLILASAQSKGRTFHELIYGHWSGKKGSMIYHPNYNYRRIR